MKKLLLPIVFLALVLGLAPSAVLTQPAPTPISPLTGPEQFVLQYAPPSGCSVNCFTTANAIKAFAGGGGNTITLTADTDIAAHSSVSINAAGHAVQTWGPAPQIAGTATLFNGPTASIPALYGLNPGVIPLGGSTFLAYQPNPGGVDAGAYPNEQGAVSFVASGHSIEVGTPSTSGGLGNIQAAIGMGDGQTFVFAYQNGSETYLQSGSVSAGVISLTEPVAISGAASAVIGGQPFVALNETSFVFTYTLSQELYAVVGTLSGGISLGTPTNTGVSAGTDYGAMAAMSATQVVIAYFNSSSNNLVSAFTATISGTDFTPNSVATVTSSSAIGTPWPVIAALDDSRFVVTWAANGSNNDSTEECFAAVGSISADSISFGSQEVVNSAFASSPPYIAVLSSSKVAFLAGATHPTIATISGTSLAPVLGAPFPLPGAALSVASRASSYPLGAITTSFWQPNWPSLVAAGSNLIWTDGFWNIYEGDGTGIVSPSVSHPGIVSYAFAPLSSSQVIALLVDGASNVLARLINFELINSSTPIGFSNSAVTSGNAVTITLPGGTATGLSDQAGAALIPGTPYYHNGDSSIVTANTGHKAGVALTTSTLLIQNYLLNRDLDPSSNDNSPAFMDEAA
jgi:hypothetical protein